MLEDTLGDILEKARIGLMLDADALCRHAGLPRETYQGLLRGAPPSDQALKQLANALDLDAEGLNWMVRGLYRSEPALLPAALERIETCHKGYSAYAYLWKIPAAHACLLFDAGFESGPILEAIERSKCTLKGIFITHAHRDHIGGAAELRKQFPSAKVFAPGSEQLPIADLERLEGGEHILFEKIALRTIDTPGHTAAALTYFVENPDWPIAFTGDALFAGSMGGAPGAYAEALQSAGRLMELPPATLLCPGHGPYTTVGYEQAHNPFFSRRAQQRRCEFSKASA